MTNKDMKILSLAMAAVSAALSFFGIFIAVTENTIAGLLGVAIALYYFYKYLAHYRNFKQLE